MARILAVGDLISEFNLTDQNGGQVYISPQDKQKRIIYFYPKNNTRKCTEQACSFRDWYEVFIAKGFQVIGISHDSVKSQRQFKKQHKINYTLLSDPKGRVRKLFGASSFFGLLPNRKTYIINQEGRIEFIYEKFFEGTEHVQKVLEQIQE